MLYSVHCQILSPYFYDLKFDIFWPYLYLKHLFDVFIVFGIIKLGIKHVSHILAKIYYTGCWKDDPWSANLDFDSLICLVGLKSTLKLFKPCIEILCFIVVSKDSILTCECVWKNALYRVDCPDTHINDDFTQSQSMAKKSSKIWKAYLIQKGQCYSFWSVITLYCCQ